MLWNNKVQDCLERGQKERVTELERKKKDINNLMNELTLMCLEDMDKLSRTKVETLVTIHVYQRDTYNKILEDAKQYKIRDASDFDWVKNTRLYWKHDEEHVAVQICDVEFIYSYEFLGAKERLCITPLTDRCYITLSQALGMLYGGAPAGPAGTGKTETVKDLGRTLGIFVVVTNCSDEHKYRDMAKIFKGVCQSGLWGCFDEFNRISLATLSVVAAQVESITIAKKQGLKRFMFPNEPLPIGLIAACGYFITMNPGYAGRQELPNNLKVQFRSVSMMMPNRQVIMKVKLASVGYSTYDPLSKKFNVLYKLCEEQLSKQRHYDFGLRNILSVLRTAGNVKRSEKADADEEMLIARTLRDMNLSKFVAQDQPLFESLIRDIFPRQTNIPKKVYKEIEGAVKTLLKANNLVDRPQWFIKIIQLYETSLVRHGFMTVGPVGCGKTTINNILTEALTSIGLQHKITRMNPKAITGQEMYGVMNTVTGEWVPGVYSQIWKKCNDRKNKYTSWIQCDGPVDAIWVENLNTVLDDNRILTLANAERIPMTDNCKMTFEVGNLDNASPATVSRCGIVYVSESDLNWEPLIETWIRDRVEEKKYCHPEEGAWLTECIKKYIEKKDLFILLVKEYTYVMFTPPVVRISQMLNLITAVLQQFLEKQEQLDRKTFEMYFVYSFSWAVGGLFETEEREKFYKYVESCGGPLPPIQANKISIDKETIFDYYVDHNSKTWKLWEAEQWVPPKRMAFSQLLIPTIDSTRAEFIIDKIAHLPHPRSERRKEPGHLSTLLTGAAGTAKTSVVLMYTSKFDKEAMLFKRINFSSATTPYNFQESMENEVERKQGRTFVPPGGKKMTVFLDDMSMPFVNAWGDQITLEIVRQLIDHKGFYFLSKDDRGYYRTIEGLQYLGAMNHPGGGRNDVPHRLKRQFFNMNMTLPSQRSIENIYGKILEQLFHPKRYAPEVIAMRAPLIDATIALWTTVKNRLLPTPAKFHYTFNIRELSRVFQGICAVAAKHEYEVIKKCLYIKEKIRQEQFLIGLWRHECERVFEDKLISNADKKIFHDILDKTTKERFKDSLGLEDEQLLTSYLFADFQREDKYDEYGELIEVAPFVYEAVPDIESIRKRVYTKMEGYNEKFPSKKMNLVIFDDALRHLLRITRILNSPRGNCLLVGVGGSGKQSLTKLSSFISKQVFFQIALTKTYGETHLKDDIKNLYREAGPLGKNVTFIMTDSEIKSEGFLESINSMLATGEIAGLIPKDERDVFALETKTVYMKEAGTKGEDPSTLELWIYFINRVRDCLHMVLAFSPVGTKFRERARKFPSLFSSCTIDWFLPWPEEALVSVSQKFLNSFQIECNKETKSQLEKHMGKVHDIVTDVCNEYFQRMRRYVYVTPKSYLSFIDQYKQVYKAKYDGIDKDDVNIRNGLDKLKEAAEGVEELKIDLKKEEVKLKDASEVTDRLLKDLEVENRKARIKEEEVTQVKVKCLAQKAQIMQEKEEADRDLAVAIPYLRRAEAAVDSIKPKDITELKGVRNAVDTTRLILDTINVLFQKPLVTVAPKNLAILKQEIPFIADSFDEYTKSTLTNQNFLNNLFDFSANDKDNINEETVELLEPYLLLKAPSGDEVFNGPVAKKSSQALEGMCVWAAAMSDYHKQSKIVKPKLRLLEIKTASLNEAEANLAAAEAELKETQDLKAMLQRKFDDQMAEKNALQERAAKTRKKMD
jgi:dynein heavy chain, axonemal